MNEEQHENSDRRLVETRFYDRDHGELAPLTVTQKAAKKITGLGLTSLWKLACEGRIETIKVGKRRLITYRSLQALLTPKTSLPVLPPRRGRGRPPKRLPVTDAAA
jgi:hypothetical protein